MMGDEWHQQQAQALQQQQGGAPPPTTDEDPAVAHTPPHHGYAKLIGEDFQHVLRDKRLQFGRRMGGAKPGLLGISDAKNISRVHAELVFIPDPHGTHLPGHWQMTCHGKNGMLLNDQHMAARVHFTVKHRDRLQIGDTKFYFLEPMPITH